MQEKRDTHGRFQPGHTYSRGPHKAMHALYREAVRNAISEDDLARVFLKLAEMAKRGDVAAARLIADYLLGRPTTPPDMESPTPFDVRKLSPWLRAMLGIDRPEEAHDGTL